MHRCSPVHGVVFDDFHRELMIYSGSTSAYCNTGCQPAFGTCSGGPSPSSTSACQSKTPSPSPSPPSTLQDCLASKNVPVVFASSSQFAQLAEPYNLRLPYTPAVIVVPNTTQHISDAVTCAAKNGVKVQARGGGHSYANYSSGGKNGSMVINLENFQEISVLDGIAQVGGGVRLGDMALGIYKQGQRALPHGTCPGVGVGG